MHEGLAHIAASSPCRPPKFLAEQTIAGKSLEECRTEFTEQYAEYDMCDANELAKALQAVLPDEESKAPGLLKSLQEAQRVKAEGFPACVQIAIDRFYTRCPPIATSSELFIPPPL